MILAVLVRGLAVFRTVVVEVDGVTSREELILIVVFDGRI